MKETFNLVCDVLILGMLLVTGLIVIQDVVIKVLLLAVACAAIFIKLKELYLVIKKNHDKNKE